jgi:kumamolisin
MSDRHTAKSRSTASSNRTAIPGSARSTPKEGRMVGPADQNEAITVTVIVRRRKSREFASRVKRSTAATLKPSKRAYLSRNEFENTFGADDKDIEKVEEFAHDHGLDVVEVSPARRTVILRGTVNNLSSAFGVKLNRYEHAGTSFRGREGDLTIPASLKGIIQSVHGLDDRPQARPHFRLASQQENTKIDTAGASSTVTALSLAFKSSYLPTELAKLYDFPSALNGRGEAIAIIELGGGHTKEDLDTYFKELKIPRPLVTSVSVDNAHNQPEGSADSADGEVMLDIEVAGAIAPRARIVVYYAPNTDQGFLAAITRAIHDSHYKPSVISISWGGPEIAWTPQSMNAFNDAFEDASALGVTICCASGDEGSSDERPPTRDGEIDDNLAHVDFPASSPYVLACGGTKLMSSDGVKISKEVVWNATAAGGGATGGGISDFFDMPDYQTGTTIPSSVNGRSTRRKRGLPDVAGDADPASGYIVRVDAEEIAIGGTSAVAPLYAGLITLLNQKLKTPVGFLNPLIYKNLGPKGAFRDILEGDNDVKNVVVRGLGSKHIKGYKAQPGWDACTGWGSPNGKKILSML